MALYNPHTGEISPPSEDPGNKAFVKVAYLSAMFGLVEICAEVSDSFSNDRPSPGFKEAWIDYCRYFNASEEEQALRFGGGFGMLQLR